jgi:prepilin-type processing-associated H-X9-DG protein
MSFTAGKIPAVIIDEDADVYHLFAPCSYAANMTAFEGPPHLSASFSDGTSNTVALVERYAYCGRPGVSFPYCIASPAWGPDDVGDRRATFADRGSSQVVPVTAGAPRTVASVPGMTFQVAPKVADADARVAQTPHAGGLPAAFFDGSVRTIAPSVSEEVFWSMVTPAGYEVAASDW